MASFTAKDCYEQFGYTYTGSGDAIVDPRVVEIFRTTPVVQQRSQQWFDMRQESISASSVPSVLGDNPYQDRHSVLLEKVFGKEFQSSEATLHGQKYEEVALEKFVERTGKTVFETGLLLHPKYPFIGGSPDGLCADFETVEIKCPLRRRVIPQQPPHHYIAQMLCVMECLDIPVCHFIELEVAGIHGEESPELFTTCKVHRDPEWWKRSLPILQKFWDDVLYYRKNPWELDPCKINTSMYD